MLHANTVSLGVGGYFQHHRGRERSDLNCLLALWQKLTLDILVRAIRNGSPVLPIALAPPDDLSTVWQEVSSNSLHSVGHNVCYTILPILVSA